MALAMALTGCGVPIASSDSVAISSAAGGVYDDSVLHQVHVDVDESAFETMVATYADSGEKEWLTVDVTIDGTTYRDAGLRLKGNSSLRGVSTASDPSELPWLIRLDKFIDGQTLEGWTEFVVRSSSSETAMNEAIALDLLAEAGLASEHAVSASFTVNDSDARLRLVVQHLDEAWEEENFDTEGLLYKAEAEGDWTYRGEDPESYVDLFDQETGEENLTPLIEFLDFVNNSTEAEFADQLDEWLDVEAFATYLAFEELVANTDDIDGPGNNAYLRWDAEKERFTVVAWDHNLTFGAVPGGMGGGPVDGAGGRPDAWERPDGGPAGAQAPEVQPDRPVAGPMGEEPMGRGPMGGVANPLVERFSEVDEFANLVTDAREQLQTDLIDSRLAHDLVDKWSSFLLQEAGDLVAPETVTAEADQIRSYFD